MILHTNLKRQYESIKDEIKESIDGVLEKSYFILGEEGRKFEEEFAKYCGKRYGKGVGSGTEALHLALLASGVKPGDEVITVPFTWISTAEVICILGATPVFVDVDHWTYNIDPSLLEAKITSKTKAIIPVSLYGQMADLKEINKIAEKYNIPIIEDGAQSFGATHYDYKSCSCSSNISMWKIGCTSFFPSKPLGCFGDGGACFTNDDDLAFKLKAIRTHGGTERFKHTLIGTNGRLNTIQAGILLVKLKYFDEGLERRVRNANIYNEIFQSNTNIRIPYLEIHNTHVYGQYTIKLKNQETRDNLKEYLKKNEIDSAVFYPIAIHTQGAFAKFNYKEGDFPVSEDVCNKVLSLPVYPELSVDEIKNVANTVNNFFTE